MSSSPYFPMLLAINPIAQKQTKKPHLSLPRGDPRKAVTRVILQAAKGILHRKKNVFHEANRLSNEATVQGHKKGKVSGQSLAPPLFWIERSVKCLGQYFPAFFSEVAL